MATLYCFGAMLAFAQTDLKRLVAYTSISHMGFVLLGIFAWNELALQGVIIIMIAHAVSTGGLFILVGQLYERTGTRDLRLMGGLWEETPRMSRVGLVLALAALGGLGHLLWHFSHCDKDISTCQLCHCLAFLYCTFTPAVLMLYAVCLGSKWRHSVRRRNGALLIHLFTRAPPPHIS